MRRYSYKNNKKSRKEKIGFLTAFSICIVAVGLALWSTYSSIGGFENSNVTEPTYIAVYPPTEPVGRDVTGVVVTETEPTEEKVVTTQEPEPLTTVVPVGTETQELYTGDSESLQTMLQVSASLDFPVHSGKILKEYSEDVVYNSTMGDYRAHTGVDFRADEGENVLAMCDGSVEEIYADSMYGNVIKVKNGNFTMYYCGVSDTMYCVEGSQVTRGDIIGKVGTIPCEAQDEMHLHVEIKVGDKYIDPLLIIDVDE